MADPVPVDIKKLLQQFQGNLTPDQLTALRSQIESSYAINYSSTYDYEKGALVYADQRAASIAANEQLIKDIDARNNTLRSIASATFPPTGATTIVPTVIDGINVLIDNDTKIIYLPPTSGTAPKETAALAIKTNNEERAKIQAFNASVAAAPRAQADALMLDLQKLALQKGMQADERAAAAAEAAANRGASIALAQTATVQTIITTKIDEKTGKEIWVVRQILKDGTTNDTLYNPSPADRAKALYTAADGSIGQLGETGQNPVWSYRPPRITSQGENKYSQEFNAKTQDWDGPKTTISTAGQKLEFWNGKVYRTYTDEKGNYTVEEVQGIPSMSEAQAKELGIAERNVKVAEGRAAVDAETSRLAQEKAQLEIDAAKAAKQTGSDIIAGQLTVIEGLIKSGTPADLAKAQELYQSARRDWEVEKKNATDRRDKAQEKGLRRSGMQFLRGATAVQGGKTGADAQQMWREEYNRTPGREGETYSERMARALGLGADLDQNLNTEFPTFREYAKGVTANANADGAASSTAAKPVAPAVPAAIGTAPLPETAKPVSKRPIVGYGEPIAVPTTVANDGKSVAPGTALQVGGTGQGPGRGSSTAVTELRTVDNLDGTATTFYSDGIATRWNINPPHELVAEPFVAKPPAAPAVVTPPAFERVPGEGQFQRPPAAVNPPAAPAVVTPPAFERVPGEGQFQRPPTPAPQQQQQQQQQQQTPSNYQGGGQGYFAPAPPPPPPPPPPPEPPQESAYDRLARIHNRVNGENGDNYSGRGE